MIMIPPKPTNIHIVSMSTIFIKPPRMSMSAIANIKQLLPAPGTSISIPRTLHNRLHVSTLIDNSNHYPTKNIFRMASGGLTAQRIFIFPPQLSHFKASTAKTRFRRSAQACLRGRDCISFAFAVSFAIFRNGFTFCSRFFGYNVASP